MASRKLKGEDFVVDESAEKGSKRRKQYLSKEKRRQHMDQGDPLQRKQHRWRKRSDREEEFGLSGNGRDRSLDEDELPDGEEPLDESLDFEDENRFTRDEYRVDEDLTDYDVEYDRDEWE